MDYNFEIDNSRAIMNTIENLAKRIDKLEEKNKTTSLNYDVTLNTSRAKKQIEKLGESLEEIHDKYGELIDALNPIPIIYNYYGCSFNYGEQGTAMASNGAEEVENEVEMDYDD